MLISQYGAQAIVKELQILQGCVEQKYYPVIDDIMNYIEHQSIPPLAYSRPLSYRSDVTSAININNTHKNMDANIHLHLSLHRYLFSVLFVELLLKTKICCSDNESERSQTDHDMHLHNYILKWFYLIPSDEYVLESIENSLVNSSEPSELLRSCEFFNDVMLHDFPAEVFLQRPTVITVSLSIQTF